MFFDDIQAVTDLRERYLELVKKYHPDIGGNSRLMQRLNDQYREKKDLLKKKQDGFQHLLTGDTVFVNGTECFVVSFSEKTFVAQAKGRERRAIFDKYSGRCITNRKFKAHHENG